ncbi:heterokaryon incompatibility protein-domain-containing protein [Cladorrhinum sp. PSN332]|nr:heterokaryon incompatibility protein-domain-containing protein [Cladorrhinum sp. PSN332]
MRLLNVNTFKLEEFVGDQVQVITYAILSHTWEGKEVTFQDIQQQDAVEKLEHPPNSAWAKIKNSCAQARKDGFGHIWIDTCCIDKSSSAELQEAINSMFNWYLESMVCYAYLSDVPPTPGSDIAVSRWFTRGWTLQELLAPNHITFFDCTWTPRGQRGDSHLLGKISSKTRINTQVLAERERLHYHRRNPDIVHRFLRKISVAEKMSWAADRETTRIEDQAYCLLGLFDINMPMLYGEGDKAFKRLQHELMRATDDCTLLAWGYGQRTRELRDLEPFHAEVEPPMPIGILARAPTDFRHAGDLVPCRIGPFGRPSFSLSQRGITMSLPVRDDPNSACCTASYPCSRPASKEHHHCRIWGQPGTNPPDREHLLRFQL